MRADFAAARRRRARGPSKVYTRLRKSLQTRLADLARLPILRFVINAAATYETVESVEALTDGIARLVSERQRLRAAGADDARLEENRLEIARLQQRLSKALIRRYLPAAA